MKKQWIVTLGVLAVIAVGLVAVIMTGSGSNVVSVGSTAPAFVAKTLDVPPRQRSLADYRGQVVLLNIWATYCEPCEVEMPSIESLYEQFAPKGLKVVAVAIDDPGFEPQIRAFTARHALTFDILNEGSGKIETDYQALGIPSTYIIGRDGRIRKRVTGASDWNSPSNRALIAELLGIPGSSAGAAP